MEVESKIEKIISNNKKLDEAIVCIEANTKLLSDKRNALKEEVSKLNGQVVSINKELSINNQLKTMLEDEIQKKLHETKVVATELEQLKWKNTWYSVIAANQSAELKVNYDKMEALAASKKSKENSHCDRNKTDNLDTGENEVINQLKDENTKLKQQIHFLKSRPNTDITEMEKEIANLKDRNDKILKRLKAQLAQLEYRNSQDYTYFKSLQKEMEETTK